MEEEDKEKESDGQKSGAEKEADGGDEEGSEEKKKVDSEDGEEEEEIFIPQAEYSAVCNSDFLPMICNDFIQEFMDKDHGACQLTRTEAINLTRNFCHWIAHHGLTCARIQLYSSLTH